MIIDLLALALWIGLAVAIIVGVATLAHKLSYHHRSHKLRIVTEWQARKNAAPLSSAFSRHTEHNEGPGPVSVTRDHRGLE